jgi:hypothetical protein
MFYLYVKTHNKTGLKYLGKTEQDPFVYLGSGKRWLNHLKVHGIDISTEIIFQTEDKNLFKQTAVYYSNLFNIVESNDWANILPEEGDGGNTSKFIDYSIISEKAKIRCANGFKPVEKHTKETKEKMSLVRKGVKRGPYKTYRGIPLVDGHLPKFT